MTGAAIIRGVVGQIRWAYYTAAQVEGFTVIRNQTPRPPGVPARWSMRGRVVLTDPFKLTQKPLIFVAPHAKGKWQWPIEDLVITDGELTARLGPVEEY